MKKRILLLQCADVGHYPPIMHVASLFADGGWEVTILSSPSSDGSSLRPTFHPDVIHREVVVRPVNRIRSFEYLRYVATSGLVAARLRPDFIYAFDPLGALPALVAAKASGGKLIYHEHDSPDPGGLRLAFARWRAQAARKAMLVILPNAERARIVQQHVGFEQEKLRIVWNAPRRAECPAPISRAEHPLILHYHGNISSVLLPEQVVGALARFGGRIRLRIAGYEPPNGRGHVSRLMNLIANAPIVECIGAVPRGALLEEAAHAHVGLALMPGDPQELNIRHLAGASNKAFDYMAAGLALLVSDLPDWQRMFVVPGYARACDPTKADDIENALQWFLDHPNLRKEMAERARAKIVSDWNYDTLFRPVIDEVNFAFSARSN